MSEPAAGPSGPGTVVLELGPGIGALVLYTPPGLDGTEIEISRDDEPGTRRTHSQVRPRHLPGQTRYAAVYPALREGAYTIWRDHHTAAGAITITGGQVTNWHWPS